MSITSDEASSRTEPADAAFGTAIEMQVVRLCVHDLFVNCGVQSGK